ncbi:hypothetical protein Dtox_3729 [Desulfofarcimen acetoxidans DSM 771]|uniref:Uncharacterized protein n=1 Tax=Desulfofarcimen acetoxidans (strain ATCC 49208 / DSM 771 / KCTC 5769 / VKM B-1644 / 5575) TaxID=485916 RepID=C8VWS3_DESAS|nr:hypothetical protein [Desulfofarcimen acetoxidans]ACV64437.1 hypothetical protein Dtox_3729 [Desulfofarcimen acetoxidans DSM 771]
MPSIIWKPITGNYYAYLQECYYDPQRKGPKTKNIYLGSTPKKAEEKLKQFVTDGEQLTFYIEELYRKRPTGKPPSDEIAVAVKAIDKLTSRFKDKRVKDILSQTLDALKQVQQEV